MKQLLLSAAALVAPLAISAIPMAAHAATPTPPAILEWKSTVKGWNDSTYWYDTDGKRYAFTQRASFTSWFPGNPTGVVNATIPELAPIPLGGAVFHKPGERLIKFASSPNVYAVSRYGVLRHLATEQVAFELYGENWKTQVDELPVTDYSLYVIGSMITDSAEYDRTAYLNATNPSSNAVNATNRPPETFTGKMTLTTNASDVYVGKTFTLTAHVNRADTNVRNLIIRMYDTQGQVIGTCSGSADCQIVVTAGGPTGPQYFTARAFNEYEQSFSSDPVNLNIANQL
jgi:hypothetical protein